MSYSAEISRNNPTCFLFVIDQSGSMADKYINAGLSKADALATTINNMFQGLVLKCAKGDTDNPMGVRNYFYVGVIGYGGNGVTLPLQKQHQGKDLVSVSDIANFPARIEERVKKIPDGAGGLVETTVKFPIWFDATASGGTPMKEAFTKANQIIDTWLQQNPDSFPPVVIHITDGESTDGSPIEEMNKLKAQASSDGNVVLFNLHTHARSESLSTITFPNSDTSLPDQYAKMLYQGASVLPEIFKKIASNDFGMKLQNDAKAFLLNGGYEVIITALEIGTRASLQLMR